jgi:hypothetical protein
MGDVRPQIQEEAITQMAELLMDKVRPDGLAVVMEADHFCMHWRGVKDDETKMINSVMRGSSSRTTRCAANSSRSSTSKTEFPMLVRLPLRQPRRGATTAPCSTPSWPSRAKNNPALGITGLLCVSDDLFMQVLEGGRDEVCELYNTIVRDDRHHRCAC